MHSVAVHLGPGRFTTGFYRMDYEPDGWRLTMTYDDGQDVEPLVSAKLRVGDDHKAIASVLTKEIRNRMISPFWDEMTLPETGIA